MAMTRTCDCCGAPKAKRVALGMSGFIEPRQLEGADLCESCLVAFQFKWGELKKGGKR